MTNSTYHSEAISEIAKALSAFQAKLPTIPKDKMVKVKTRTGGEYSYSYAPYDTIIEKIKKPLNENGLSFTQIVCGDDLITMLLHSSGEWFKTVMKLTCNPADQQSYGSDITYKRRYSLSAILGIATDEDDDANTVQESTNKNQDTADDQHHTKPVLNSKSKAWENAIKSYQEYGNLDRVKQFADVSPEVEQQIKNICEATNKKNQDDEVPL